IDAVEKPLGLGDAVRAALQPDDRVVLQGTGEEVAAPLREERARVDGEAGDRRRDLPEPERRGHALQLLLPSDRLVAVVFAAEGLHRPAVVAAGLREVDLVAAARAVLDGPERPVEAEG